MAGIGSGTPDGPGWQTYVAVDDLEPVLDAVAAAGGTVTTGPTVAGEGGTWAEIVDPSGAVLRLWKANRRLGAQIVNAPGAWNFSDLHADDPATGFYETVFGWEITDVWFATMIRVPGYGDHLAATTDPDIRERQASVSVPPGFEDAIGWVAPAEDGRPPHWHVTFAVADRDETAALAAAARRRGAGHRGRRVGAHGDDPGPAGRGVHREPVHSSGVSGEPPASSAWIRTCRSRNARSSSRLRRSQPVTSSLHLLALHDPQAGAMLSSV